MVGAVAGLLRELDRLGECRSRGMPPAGVELDAGEPDKRVGEQVGGSGVTRFADQPSQNRARPLVPTGDGERRAEIRVRVGALVAAHGVRALDQLNALVVIAGEDERGTEMQRRG
jgi:hypothetical protein